MDIALKSRVSGTDGEIGVVENLIINPVVGRLAFLVVKETASPNALRLVPEKMVAKADHENVVLSLDAEKFHGLTEFIQNAFIPPSMFMYLAREEHVDLPIVPSSWTVEYEAAPNGSIVIRRHEPVFATDGRVGRVDEFLAERKTGRITHLILTEGHLWGKREVRVPVALVDRYEDGAVHLKVDKEAVEMLPDVK